MMDYSFGDVVLVSFPHTDYARVSKRPALVIYDGEDQDILLARITSQIYSSEADYSVADWQKAGLITESYVRLGKLATIEKRYVIRKLGQLLAYEKDSVKLILQKIICERSD
ncbi:type II toxin-antitoxin system PemK/MazF family toxin [Desulfonatronovibrio magnus]|uniref:type II toxin-antitoxin system PemK/MazF family toxin n=1 Tax=Desulfonatronovibrio magnus TaxID=698827 RepID=UPI0005EAE445|nr:type II toxin-antitoxin system PemK/MazF family toxin [Desulfonatronovibrio magnus]